MKRPQFGTSNEPLVVKIFNNNGGSRRQMRRMVISNPSISSWESLKKLSEQQFNLKLIESPFTVRYRNEDGDSVTVSTASEFMEAMQRHRDDRGVLRLWIVDHPGFEDNDDAMALNDNPSDVLGEGEVLRQIQFSSPDEHSDSEHHPLQQSRCSSSNDDDDEFSDFNEMEDAQAPTAVEPGQTSAAIAVPRPQPTSSSGSAALPGIQEYLSEAHNGKSAPAEPHSEQHPSTMESSSSSPVRSSSTDRHVHFSIPIQYVRSSPRQDDKKSPKQTSPRREVSSRLLQKQKKFEQQQQQRLYEQQQQRNREQQQAAAELQERRRMQKQQKLQQQQQQQQLEEEERQRMLRRMRYPRCSDSRNIGGYSSSLFYPSDYVRQRPARRSMFDLWY